MQPNLMDVEDPTPNGLATLFCTKCAQKEMIPAIDEGEPDYTDKYVCRACGHHASIPSVGLVIGQCFSGALGCLLCLYLLVTQFSSLMSTAQISRSIDKLQGTGAIALAAVFLVAFGFVIYQSYRGLRTRNEHCKPPKKTL